jgi:hypothetical protein
MTREPVIHVTFGMYNDKPLREALKQAGRRDCVVRLSRDVWPMNIAASSNG